MKVIRGLESESVSGKFVATVGTFDGVHQGHRKILTALKSQATQLGLQSLVVTFDPHPQILLNPAYEISLLNTLDEKINLLEQAGVDVALVIPFDKNFSSMKYDRFIKEILIDKLKVSAVVIGYDHHFGNERIGDVHHLSELAFDYDLSVTEIAPYTSGDVAISSTRVRLALKNGEIDIANEMLGYEYFFSGKVISGNKIGRTIGFPTANIKVNEVCKLLPANGVYVVKVEYNNRQLDGMLNIGYRPTVNGNDIVPEVNIFNFDEEIYDAQITVKLKSRIRNEQKFDSVEALRKQLEEDKSIALKLL